MTLNLSLSESAGSCSLQRLVGLSRCAAEAGAGDGVPVHGRRARIFGGARDPHSRASSPRHETTELALYRSVPTTRRAQRLSRAHQEGIRPLRAQVRRASPGRPGRRHRGPPPRILPLPAPEEGLFAQSDERGQVRPALLLSRVRQGHRLDRVRGVAHRPAARVADGARARKSAACSTRCANLASAPACG